MSPRIRDLTLVAATAILVGVCSLTVAPLIGQAPAGYPAARAADGHPNLGGIWQALNTANWDLEAHVARPALAVRPGRVAGTMVPAAPVIALGAVGAVPGGFGVVEGGNIPYQPWAAAKKKENVANWLGGDPEQKCFMPGVPRATYMPHPFQIVQGTKKIMMIYTFAGATRTIEMGGTEEAPVDSWMGWSNGRWEGDTLVVDVTGFNKETWFDRAGNFHSEALHVVERYTPISPYHLQYEATIEDPKVFTRPWKISMPLYRAIEANAELMDFKCVEFVEELMFGKLRKEPLPAADDFRKWYDGFVRTHSFTEQAGICRRFAVRNRRLVSLAALTAAVATVALAQVPVAGQSGGTSNSGASAFAPSRTPWGDPNLQGVWDYRMITPLQRPDNLAGKAVLTDEEAAAYEEEENRKQNRDLVDLSKGNERSPALAEGGAGGVVVPYNEFWYDRGNKVVGSKRTALIVDPPDGKVPRRPRAAGARQAGGGGGEGGGGNAAFSNPEDLGLGLRCVARPLPRISGPYNNNVEIVQAPGFVVLTYEMAHDARIVPLDGRPHLPSTMRQWMGDSRGHWEGSTLVIDTVNFTAKAPFQGSTENLHLVERYTLRDDKTLSYEFTMEDAAAYTRPWTVEFPMLRNPDRMYEYGCQEHNYAIQGILGGTREQERRAVRQR